MFVLVKFQECSQQKANLFCALNWVIQAKNFRKTRQVYAETHLRVQLVADLEAAYRWVGDQGSF